MANSVRSTLYNTNVLGQYVDPFAGLTKYANQQGQQIREDEKYAAEKAQKDTLFAQQQDEYKRKLGERAAADAFQNTMLEDPTERAGWITDAVASSKNANLLGQGELYGDLNAYEAAAKTGGILPKMYSDAAQTKELAATDITKRLAFQQHPTEMLKSVVGDELRAQQMTRALDNARNASRQYMPSDALQSEKEQGYLSPELAKKYEDAKIAEVTATGAERTRLLGQMDAAEKTYQGYKKLAVEKGLDNKTEVSDYGERTTTDAPLRPSLEGKKVKDKNGVDVEASSALADIMSKVKDQVSPFGIAFMGTDASEVEDATTNALSVGYNPKVIEDALQRSLDYKGVGTNLNKKLFADNLAKLQPDSKGVDEDYSTKMGTTTVNSGKKSVKQTTYADAKGFLEEERKIADAEKARIQKELNKLDLSPAERQAIKMQDSVDKWLGMLTPTTPSVAPKAVSNAATSDKEATAPTKEGKVTKILAAPITVITKKEQAAGNDEMLHAIKTSSVNDVVWLRKVAEAGTNEQKKLAKERLELIEPKLRKAGKEEFDADAEGYVDNYKEGQMTSARKKELDKIDLASKNILKMQTNYIGVPGDTTRLLTPKAKAELALLDAQKVEVMRDKSIPRYRLPTAVESMPESENPLFTMKTNAYGSRYPSLTLFDSTDSPEAKAKVYKTVLSNYSKYKPEVVKQALLGTKGYFVTKNGKKELSAKGLVILNNISGE